MSKKRPRLQTANGNKDLEAVLMEFFVAPNMISYGEGHDDSKLNKAALIKAAPLLRKLRALQPNCSFAPVTMKNALVHVAVEQQRRWAFSAADIESFSTAVGKRLRTMCRHWMQALTRPTPPKWAQDVAGPIAHAAAAVSDDDKGEGSEEGDDEEEDSEAKADQSDELDGDREEEEEEQEEKSLSKRPAAASLAKPVVPGVDSTGAVELKFWVGWDSEQNLAWRTMVGDKSKRKEFTNTISVPEGKPDIALVIATWDDGWSKEIPSVSIGRWKAMLDSQAPKASLWSGSGYVIRRKADRSELVYLVHETAKSKQLCQIKVAMCLSFEDAVALMKEVK
jgi:hypothetical protein